ncbi:MAG: citrate synthase [Frankiaceae bacterium]|nr:citrate synthase [Frankiaceae bacterium]
MTAPSRGLADVVAASTAISDIDGQAGRLSYRGYDIHDLGGQVSFEEAVYLLQRGSLPTRAELDGLVDELAAARAVPPLAAGALPAIAKSAAPMEALRSLLSLVGHDDPDKDDNSGDANARKAVRLVGVMPTLVASYQAARTGGDVPEPDPALGVAGNFLLQITGRVPEPESVSAFDECLVLHADHTMNASTFAARVCAATLSDMHSAVVAAVATLKGPLHGGANEAVMRTLESIDGGVDAVPAAVKEILGSGQKIMGFGHRVYRTEDPRATHLRKLSGSIGRLAGDTQWYEMSLAMEQAVMAEKSLYPNVDFYAASVYRSLGIPTDLFTPVFAVSRMAGWTAHVMEQHADNRLIRPDSDYVGERDRRVVPLAQRG